MPQFGDLPGGGSYYDKAGGYDGGSYGGRELASVKDRWIAAAIDYGWIVVLIAFPRFLDVGTLTILLLVWLNSGVAQGLTGKSLGKYLMGLKLGQAIIDRNGDMYAVYPGVKVATKRTLTHWRDLLSLGSMLHRSSDRQSYADQRNSTFVFTNDMRLQPKPRQWSAVLPR